MLPKLPSPNVRVLSRQCDWSVIRSFLAYLNRSPHQVHNVVRTILKFFQPHITLLRRDRSCLAYGRIRPDALVRR